MPEAASSSGVINHFKTQVESNGACVLSLDWTVDQVRRRAKVRCRRDAHCGRAAPYDNTMQVGHLRRVRRGPTTNIIQYSLESCSAHHGCPQHNSIQCSNLELAT